MSDDIIPRSNCIWGETTHVSKRLASYFMKGIIIILTTKLCWLHRHMMANSGIEEILKCRFAGVAKILCGKNFPSNIRASRLLVEEMSRGHITNLESYQEMMDVLHDVSSRSWVENLIKPVFLLMTFVRAERGGRGGGLAITLMHVHKCSPISLL